MFGGVLQVLKGVLRVFGSVVDVSEVVLGYLEVSWRCFDNV